jgi:hypothetical protein
MDSKLVDSKLQVIYDRYRDRSFAENAQKEVESFRKQSFLVGMTTSVLAFVGNEFIRLTMRSRMNSL